MAPNINAPPPLYNPSPLPVPQTLTQPPVQFSHYNPPVFRPQVVTQPINYKVTNNPNNYQAHGPSYIEPSHQGSYNFYGVNTTNIQSYLPHTSVEAPKFTIEQINQQLEESRKLFPQ